MSKYSKAFKLEVIQYYLENHIGTERLSKHFSIPNCSVVKDWIRKYKRHGLAGLERNNNKELDVDVIRFYKDKEYCPKFIVVSAAPYGSMFLPQEQLPIEKYIVKSFDFSMITQTLEDVRNNIYPIYYCYAIESPYLTFLCSCNNYILRYM